MRRRSHHQRRGYYGCYEEPGEAAGRGPVRRLRRYVGARMQRRLFLWFGVAIVATACAVVASMRVLSDGGRSWHDRVAQVERFVAGRFARAWHDPAAREELARALGAELELGVQVSDASRRVLHDVAMPEACRHRFRVPVHDPAGARLGEVALCADQHFAHPAPWRGALTLLAAAGVLWALSGVVARRIARPLAELTRVARELGEGRLSSRARLRHGLHDEVGDLTAAVNDMAERIEAQMRDQRELLAAVSHELRTPLTRIRLLLELARDGGAGRDVLAEIDGEVVEIDSLVGDLLANARLDFSALSPRELDAGEVARRAVERAGNAGARADVPPDAGPLVADATLLARALAALLDNAKKYGGDGVVLRVVPDDDRVTFEVDDDGPGFEPGDEDRVLEAFYRGRSPTGEKPAGLGLGLALVRRIAEAHGGRAYARNRDGGGARVAIELPRDGQRTTA